MQEKIELEHCTFRPKINRPKSVININRPHSAYNYSPLNQSTVSIKSITPPNYDKSVERIRSVRREKEAQLLREEKAARGERYDKSKLEQIRPPRLT
jgi:hypothetical protein